MDTFPCFALLFFLVLKKKMYWNITRGKVGVRPNEKQNKQNPLKSLLFQKVNF